MGEFFCHLYRAKNIFHLHHVPPFGENGQCAQKKYISLFPLLAQCRSGSAFFFFFPYTLSKRVCMERRRKKASHSCTGPGVGRGKCIFSGCIVRFLHKMVLRCFYSIELPVLLDFATNHTFFGGKRDFIFVETKNTIL